MFIGHIGLGLAAKRAAPRVSLAVLLSAAQFADLLWPVLVASGAEQVRIAPGITAFTPLEFVSYPYSHSLLTLVVWGLLFGAGYVALAGRLEHERKPKRNEGARVATTSAAVARRRTIAILAVLVVSHWVLDYVTHIPDMPLYPHGPRVGLGLWNSIPATMAVEVPMYVAGVWIYFRATRPRDRRGRWGAAALVAFLGLAYTLNITGPPPPTVAALWMTALAGAAVLTFWAWWADRHREAILMQRFG